MIDVIKTLEASAKKILIGAALLGSASACAPTLSSTYEYVPSELRARPETTRAYPERFDVVWDRLVRELSRDFFVINNIEKVSRIINLSVSSNDLNKYVDCGRSKRVFVQNRTTTNYEYAVTDTSTFKMAAEPSGFGYYFEVTRTPSMQGRINIYIAPKGAGTEISVNTRYMITLASSYRTCRVNAAGVVLGCQSQVTQSDNSQITFNTKDVGRTLSGDTEIICRATGALERHILSLAAR